MTTTTTRPRTRAQRHHLAPIHWTALLGWAEALWRSWRRDRVYLVERCLSLEIALQHTRCDRDDWFQIARTLAHRLDEAREWERT